MRGSTLVYTYRWIAASANLTDAILDPDLVVVGKAVITRSVSFVESLNSIA